MRLVVALTMSLAPIVAIPCARAVEVGQTVSLRDGPVETVLAVKRLARDSARITTRVMAANAAEFCERVEKRTYGDTAWQTCVRANLSKAPTTLTVNCKTSAIVVSGGSGSGSYRRDAQGGTWAALAGPASAIRGEPVYATACANR